MANDTTDGNNKKYRRIKPTLDTKFHIDYDWWENQKLELRAYLISLLPEDQRGQFSDLAEGDTLDWVDPETAEVQQMDPLVQALNDLVEETDFSQMPLVDAVFKVFLTNGNSPLSPNELSDIVGRPAKTILRTFSGVRVYRGIRPAVD